MPLLHDGNQVSYLLHSLIDATMNKAYNHTFFFNVGEIFSNIICGIVSHCLLLMINPQPRNLPPYILIIHTYLTGRG